jgi:hypothetical protein
MASLFGTSKVNLLFDQILVNEPGTSIPTVWHQGITHWPVERAVSGGVTIGCRVKR